MSYKFSKSILLMLLTLKPLLNRELQHIFVVCSNGMLVKKDSNSRQAMTSPGSLSAISLANSILSFTVNILVAIDSWNGTRNLSRLYVGVLISDIISLKRGQLSTNCLWNLQRLQRIPNLEPLGFKHLKTVPEINSDFLKILQEIWNMFLNINNEIQLFILGPRNLSKFIKIK